jgi:hypothetical protein
MRRGARGSHPGASARLGGAMGEAGGTVRRGLPSARLRHGEERGTTPAARRVPRVGERRKEKGWRA